MKRKFQAFCIMLTVVSCALNNISCSMEEKQEEKIVLCNKNLDQQAQEKFILKGAELLKKIVQSESKAMINEVQASSLFEDFQETLFSLKKNCEYSKVDNYMPSKLVHEWFASTDKTYNQARKNHLTALVAISWALAHMAEKAGEAFERGSFTIIDPDYRLSNFFKGYVQLVLGLEKPEEKSFFTTTSNYAYRRDPQLKGSSHHVDCSPGSQFGIDVRLEANEGILTLLPYSMAHILFAPKLDLGKDKPNVFFLKLEEVGLGSVSNFIGHSLSFGKSGNVQKDCRREKDVDKNLKEIFSKLLNALKIEQKATSPYKKIYQMYEFVSQQDVKIAEEFMNTLNKLYPKGHHNIRVGNEVILDLRALDNED